MVLTIRWLHMLVLLASIVLAHLLQGCTLNSKQNAKHNTTQTHNTTLHKHTTQHYASETLQEYVVEECCG